MVELLWPVVQEKMTFKGFIFYFSSDCHFIQWRKSICAILVEDFRRNIFVKKTVKNLD